MVRTVPLILLLMACTKQDEDTDFTIGLVASNVDIPTCDTEDTAAVGTETLTGNQLAPDTVAFEHRSFEAQCCAAFEVRAVIVTRDSSIRVDYLDNGTPCDCMCRYDLDYMLAPIPVGTYEVLAEGFTTEISVQ